MKRRAFLAVTAAAAAFPPRISQAQDLAPAQPGDWSGNTPLRYPDPDIDTDFSDPYQTKVQALLPISVLRVRELTTRNTSHLSW